MELIRRSAINETWKLCTLAGFLGLFLLTLLITTNNNTKTLRISAFPPPPEKSLASQPSFTNIISDAVILQSFDPPNLEDKILPSSLSPPEIKPATSAGVSELEIPAAQANFTNTTSESVSLFQSINSSAIQEKLYSSLPESDPTKKKCRMYEGKWVYKPAENPRYHVNQCNFLEEKMSCRRNGRPDSDYEGWSWESDGCRVPLFNGTDMLNRLRKKRMIIVGDSVNRNLWESLACLLYTSVGPRRAYVDSASPTYKVFKAKDYKFTLEFYWAPFLVDLDENHKSGKWVLSLDKMVSSSKQWPGASVMVFNSGHWWTHRGKLRSWDVFEYGAEQAEEMQIEVAYNRAMTSWAHWVAHNVDQSKTKVYFRSISPEHSGKQWCFNHSRPMTESDEPYRQYYPRSMIDVVEQKIREMNGQDGLGKTSVRYLNITGLSSYRIDAHPSIYRFKDRDVITNESLLRSRADCSHWCLPGLPDTWNRILYASLFFDHLVPGDLSTS